MRSDKDVKLRFFFENLNFPAKKIDLGTGVGDGDRHREKMTYRQTKKVVESHGKHERSNFGFWSMGRPKTRNGQNEWMDIMARFRQSEVDLFFSQIHTKCPSITCPMFTEHCPSFKKIFMAPHVEFHGEKK